MDRFAIDPLLQHFGNLMQFPNQVDGECEQSNVIVSIEVCNVLLTTGKFRKDWLYRRTQAPFLLHHSAA